MNHDIQQVTKGSPYQGYLYSYPHKTSYRPLDAPQSIQDTWAEEDLSQLFLYMHIPFCEMRCGFCNLFTSARPKGGQDGQIVKRYLDSIELQAQVLRQALPTAKFTRLALGGGTPTYLEPDDLQRLFVIAKTVFGLDLEGTPISVESSPETATAERLAVLRAHHVDRISIGVQSFLDEEVRSVGRAQKRKEVLETLTRMRDMGFPNLNIDLMYGLPEQTEDSWAYSLQQTLEFAPQEVYLYPLYVRPLTGFSKLGRSWDDQRLSLYRFGRDFLCERGYEQVSMRMFRKVRPGVERTPVYCCQEDGMLGLGPGARSYTNDLHYSSEYAVGAAGVREIIEDFGGRSAERMAEVDYGIRLDRAEQKRRYTILSLLHIDGLSFTDYQARFDNEPIVDFPELSLLCKANLAQMTETRVQLTRTGFERADAIGPWLHSANVQALMGEFELR